MLRLGSSLSGGAPGHGLRLALLGALAVGLVGWEGHDRVVQADDDEGEGDDDGGEDADSGAEDGEDTEDDEDAKDQPPVTSGGLYTLKTYPQRVIERPLTMPRGITQVRLGGGTDLSAKGAFDSFGVSLEAIHGAKDNFSVIGGFTSAYNVKQFAVYAGFEGSLIYDLVDIRVGANLHRNAIPEYAVFCNPPASPNEMPVNGLCQNMSSATTQDNLPNGDYSAGGVKFSIDLGFPFRYAFKPEIAIVALQTLMSIDFNAVDQDFVSVTPIDGAMAGQPQTMTITKGNSATPDLNPSIGIAMSPVPALTAVIFAQLRIPDFDTSAGAFQVPVTGRVEFSPNNKLDLGLEFTLLNVNPPEGQSPIDNRFLSLFIQSRFGK